MAHIKLAEGSTPSTPGGSSRVIFASSDGVYALDSAGGTTKFGAAGGGAAIGFSGSNGSFLATTVTFGNLNGVSFYTSNGSMVASYTDGGGGGGGIAAAAGTQTATSGTVVFSNSNGITFGMSGSTRITASHNGLTTAAASDHSHGNPTLNLTNLSGTTASNSAGFTLSLSAAAQSVQTQSNVQGIIVSDTTYRTGDVSFSNANGISFGSSAGQAITASYTVPSTAGLLSAIKVSAGTTSNNLSALTFSNSNGITFGLNASTLTASHNGLTTARASNDAVGLNTALTAGPLAWTVNSSGISLNASSAAGTTSGFAGNLISGSMTHNTAGLNLSLSHPAWLTTAAASDHSHGNPQLNLTNLSGTTASNSAGFTLSLSAAAGGGGADGYNILAAGTQTAGTATTVAFSDSNGISFGMSGSSRITASYTVPSTAGLLSAINISAGTTSNNLSAATFSNSNGITFGLNASTITASHNGLTSQSNQALSGSNGSFAFQTVTFGNLNGLSFYTSNGSFVGSHNGLTTARASNDAIGLNTAQTNVTWTVNSSGLSLNAAGYAGTGTTFAGANLSASITLNSVGLNLSMSAAVPGGGGAVNFSAGTTSNNLQTVVFSNSNGVSFGLNGSTITASAAGGGATTLAGWEPIVADNNSTFSSQGQNSLYMQKVRPDANYSFNNLEFRVSGSFVSSTNSQVVAHTLLYGLYSLNTANASYSSIATSSMVISASYNSNTAMGYTISQGAGSYTTTSGGTAIASLMSGFKHLYMPFTNTLSQGVDYAVALAISSATTVGTSPLRLAFWNQTIINNLTLGKIHASTILASNSSYVGDFEQGVYSATTGALPAAVAQSQMTAAVSRANLFLQFDV